MDVISKFAQKVRPQTGAYRWTSQQVVYFMHVWDVHLVWVNIRGLPTRTKMVCLKQESWTQSWPKPWRIRALSYAFWPAGGIAGTTKMSLSWSRKIKFADSIIWVCLKIVYPIYPMVLLIIIPTKWLSIIGGIYPIFRHTHLSLDQIRWVLLPSGNLT